MAVQVKAHARAGVPLRAHTRCYPGSACQLAIVDSVEILVCGASEDGITFKSEVKAPRPHSLVSGVPVQSGAVR